MGSGLFSIGVSAIQVAQINMSTTGHNIANVNTPGYSRQRTIQSSNIPLMTGYGSVGQGAHVSTIERLYNAYIAKQANSAQSVVSELDVYATELGNINKMLSDVNAGLSPAIQDFFKGVQQAASDPSSLTTRQSMVSAAQALVSRFQALESRLSEQYAGVNAQVGSYVSSINSYTQQIANLNQRIITAQSAAGQPPNDLYDQRDQMVAELNKLVGVNTTTNSDGTYNVYIGNGQQLVTGTQTTTVVATPSSADSARMTVGLRSSSGVQELPESIVTGGSLGGVLNFRSQFLDRTANDLGRMAASVALTFNAQHALGQDLQGNILGDVGFVKDFFVTPKPGVIASTLNPTGAATVSISYTTPPPYNGNFYTNLTNSDYRLQTNAAGVYTLTRLSDNISWSGANLAALNTAVNSSAQGPQGFDIAESAPLVAGSSYLLQPTREAARNISVNPSIAADTRQIALAAPVHASVGTSNTGSATITPGSVSTGYAAPATPTTLTFSSAGLSGFSSFPVDVTTDGVTVSYAADPVPFTNGATISSAGMSFVISGTPSNGDTFVIARNTNGVADNRNGTLLGQLQTQNTRSGKKATYQGVYA